MKRQMDQLQTTIKKHGLIYDFTDLDPKENELLPPKFKFLGITKYDRKEDPYLHLWQYVTFIKPAGLIKAQIVNQFLTSLTRATI